MKKHLVTLILLTLFFSANALTGVYQTYDDFKNGKLLIFDGDDYTTTGRFLEVTITGKVKGEEKTFVLKDIYGLNIDGELHRIYFAEGIVTPVKLHTTADYQLYFHRNMELSGREHRNDQLAVIYYVSKGLDAPIYRLSTPDNLIDLAASHPEYNALVKACEKYKVDVAGKVSKVIYHSPNFKLGKDIIPTIK